MGIINVTDDSFYAGSRNPGVQAAVDQALKMHNEGALFLDIGGQSTRPNAALLSAEEEASRVLPVIDAILQQLPRALISVDTFYASVAKLSVEYGASLVNDISGGVMDNDMLATVAALKVPYVLMHMKGTPQTMQSLAHYSDIIVEVTDYFIERIEACRLAGIHDIIIDPGFGFAKTAAHNFKLLKEMSALKMLGCPLLAGLSRKSTIYKTLNITAEEALNGTSVLNTIALLNGAHILRVHDVKEASEAVKLVTKILE